MTASKAKSHLFSTIDAERQLRIVYARLASIDEEQRVLTNLAAGLEGYLRLGLGGPALATASAPPEEPLGGDWRSRLERGHSENMHHWRRWRTA